MPDSPLSPLIAAYLEKRAALVRYFTVRTGSAEAAEDIVQDLYVKLSAMTPEAVAEVRSPAPFFYRLGTNLMLDRARQTKRSTARDDAWRQAQGDFVGGEDVVQAPPADEAVAVRQQLEKVVAAVNGLPPACRRAFRLHKFDGLSHAEVAAAMGISRSAVEKHISTALKRLLKEVGR